MSSAENFAGGQSKVSYRHLSRNVACLAGLTVLLILPHWASAKVNDRKETNTLGKAAGVLQEMVARDDVPPALLAKAKCIVVLPDAKKFSIGIGGTGGRGAASCRTGKNFNGPWSAPAIYSLSGVSVGLQLGGSSTDYVLLVMTDHGVDSLVKGKTKLGTSATVAAGPTGATTTSSPSGTDILSYGRATGLFAGASLGGAALEQDGSANRDLYGKTVTAHEILIANAVPAPAAAKPLMTLLNTKAKAH
jgi:lipid-binding SYLF domain-containing protein